MFFHYFSLEEYPEHLWCVVWEYQNSINGLLAAILSQDSTSKDTYYSIESLKKECIDIIMLRCSASIINLMDPVLFLDKEISNIWLFLKKNPDLNHVLSPPHHLFNRIGLSKKFRDYLLETGGQKDLLNVLY